MSPSIQKLVIFFTNSYTLQQDIVANLKPSLNITFNKQKIKHEARPSP